MTKASFEERLARLQGDEVLADGQHRFAVEADEKRRKHQMRMTNSFHDDDAEEARSTFWFFYVLSGMLIVAAIVKLPQYSPIIWSWVLPLFAIVGCTKLYLTIRRRGFSFSRDGDNLMDMFDTLSSIYKFFK